MIILVTTDFEDSLNRLSKMVNYESAYKKALKAYFDITIDKIDFKEAFNHLRVTGNGETRIDHAVKFDVGRGCRLVLVKHKNRCIFLIAGLHPFVNKWLDAHKGFKAVKNESTNEFSSLFLSTNKEQEPIDSRKVDNFTLYERLSEDDRDFLFEDLEQKILLLLQNKKRLDPRLKCYN